MEFSVVEFDDGIHLVSSSLVDTTKLNFYWPRPHVRKESVFRKMMVLHIASKQNDPSWSLYPINRVISRYCMYKLYKMFLLQSNIIILLFSKIQRKNVQIKTSRKIF